MPGRNSTSAPHSIKAWLAAGRPVQAVYWYRRAATPESRAQFNLAHCLATGTGTPRDDAAALRWMLRAARRDLEDAQFLAGVMLADGIGAAADRAAALAMATRPQTVGMPMPPCCWAFAAGGCAVTECAISLLRRWV